MSALDRLSRAREIRQAERIATRENRRALVRAMRREGLAAEAIAQRLQATGWPASLTTVYRDLRALEGPQPRYAGGWPQSARARALEVRRRRASARRRAVGELARRGLAAREIATRLQLVGVAASEEMVRRDLSMTGGA